MKVHADVELCQGHGVCESEAPEVFEVPNKGKVRVLIESPGVELIDAVRSAVKYCPTRAISIEED